MTTLSALGLGAYVKSRDLASIRRFYNKFVKHGLQGVEIFAQLVYKISGVRYAIMTNIPFDSVSAVFVFYCITREFLKYLTSDLVVISHG